MTVSFSNPSASPLTDADWRRLSPQTQEYAAASYELMARARGYLQAGDLRQASEKGWGAAAQIVKAVAENWKDSGVTIGRHQDLRALVVRLAEANREPDLHLMFHAAQGLHENFYENDLHIAEVTDGLDDVESLIDKVLLMLTPT